MLTRFFRHSRAANSAVSGEILLKFVLVQAFMVTLVNCKNEDPIKNLGARVLTTFLPLYVFMGFFSDAQGQPTPQSMVESGRNSN